MLGSLDRIEPFYACNLCMKALYVYVFGNGQHLPLDCVHAALRRLYVCSARVQVLEGSMLLPRSYLLPKSGLTTAS